MCGAICQYTTLLLDAGGEILCCTGLTRGGEIVNPRVREVFPSALQLALKQPEAQ